MTEPIQLLVDILTQWGPQPKKKEAASGVLYAEGVCDWPWLWLPGLPPPPGRTLESGGEAGGGGGLGSGSGGAGRGPNSGGQGGGCERALVGAGGGGARDVGGHAGEGGLRRWGAGVVPHAQAESERNNGYL